MTSQPKLWASPRVLTHFPQLLGSLPSVDQLSLQNAKSPPWKTRAYPSVDKLSSEFPAGSSERDLRIDGSHQNSVLEARSARWENLIINFSRSEFPADFSARKTYEKQCNGKLSAQSREPTSDCLCYHMYYAQVPVPSFFLTSFFLWKWFRHVQLKGGIKFVF